MGRAERRRRTKRIIRRRLKKGEGLIFCLGDKEKEQPHRMHKDKPGFTYGKSMKWGKQKASRAARSRAKRITKKGEEPPPVNEHNIRGNYW